MSKKKLFIISMLILLVSIVFQKEVFAKKNVANKVITAGVEEQKAKLISKIDFDDILTKAKDHAYDLKIADFDVLIAKQGVRGARSEYFPKLNLGASTEYTHNMQDNARTVMVVGDSYINPYTRFQSVLGITLNYNLFDFGVRRGNLDIAKTDVSIKELQTKEKFQELSLNIIDTYTKILITKKQINLNKQILTLNEKNLDIKKRLYNAGELSSLDVNDAIAEVEKTKRKINELNSIYEESLNWLTFYTGETYDKTSLKIDDMKRPNFDVTEFTDYTKSITWQIKEKELQKKALELKVAKRNYAPKVNLYGRYYLYNSNYSNYGKALGITPSNYTIGGSLSVPIFDGFKNSANVQKLMLEYKQLQVERDKSIAQLMMRLATMRSNLIYLDKQTDNCNSSIKELKNKDNSMNKLLSKKLISPIEINDAKIKMLEEEIELEKDRTTSIAITKGIQILTTY